jgi:uncharacterized protein YigE (DUF2233 family)
MKIEMRWKANRRPIDAGPDSKWTFRKIVRYAPPRLAVRSRFTILANTTCLFVLFVAARAQLGFAQSTTDETAVCSSAPSWLQQLLQAPRVTRTIPLSGGKLELVLVTRQGDPIKPRFGLELVAVKLPSDSFHFKLEEVRSTGSAYTIFQSHGDPRRDLVMVNGGFFMAIGDKGLSPMGLIVTNGKVKNPFRQSKLGGTMYAESGAVRIVPNSLFHLRPTVVEALQSLPILVADARPAIFRENHALANRTAVATYPDGSVVVAGAFSDNGQALSLCEFAFFLQLPESQGGLAVQTALGMDGGPGAHIRLPHLGLEWGSRSDTYLPSLVRFVGTP